MHISIKTPRICIDNVFPLIYQESTLVHGTVMLVCEVVVLVFEEDWLAVVVVKGAHYAVGVEVKLFKAVGNCVKLNFIMLDI
jgi:hypothetical protein